MRTFFSRARKLFKRKSKIPPRIIETIRFQKNSTQALTQKRIILSNGEELIQETRQFSGSAQISLKAESRVVGVMFLDENARIILGRPELPKGILISGIEVLRRYQRQGLASLMHREAEAIMADQKKPTIFYLCPTNRVAKKTAINQGFSFMKEDNGKLYRERGGLPIMMKKVHTK
jgi:GNAT superfamily N-acetyltransferase